MIRICICLAVVLSFCACNNSGSSKGDDQPLDSAYSEELPPPVIQQLPTAFPEAYQFLSAKDSSFNASFFEEAGSDTNRSKMLPLPKEIKSYYPYLIYNIDSSRAIDLYSYNIFFRTKNGKRIAEPGGPDNEVALIDFKDSTRRRVFFGGSSSAVLDAKWINGQEFLLMTGEVIGDREFQPTILKYNTSDNTLEHFLYRDTLRLNISEYRDRRIATE
jgi:hypothetical protein